MTGTFVHSSPSLFPSASTFDPSRWLSDDAAQLERWLVPFSKGPRMCVGQNLAYCELFLGLAGLFRRFDLRVEEMGEGKRGDGKGKGGLRWRECYLPLFLGKHLTVFCRKVEE
jgi:cytochrome P450